MTPVLESVAGELYEALAPLAYDDANQDYALARWSQAIGAMFQPVENLVRDTDDGPGWSILLDVARVPESALPYLAQFVGVTLDASLSDSEKRQQIRDEVGQARGSVAGMRAAALPYLTGSQSMIFFERDTSPAHLTVVTRTSETPDAAAVLAALTSKKPAGIVLAHNTVAGQTWADLIANYATWGDVIVAFPTWADVISG